MINIRSYSSQYNEFSSGLLGKYLSGRRGQNIVFSPFSILMLLAIAADATSSETRDEITKAFPFDLDHEGTIQLMTEIQTALTSSPALTSANAVCVQNKIKSRINPDYAPHLRSQFTGEFFSSPDIVSDVNSWVNQHTNGMIDKIANDSMNDMLACLMNAIAYASEWHEKYEAYDVYDENFTNADRSSKEVPMLHSTEDLYIEDESFTGFIKYYMDADYSFMALLPKKKRFAGLRYSLSGCDFTRLAKSARGTTVHVTMPEFTFSFEDDLTGFFKDLGIRSLFSPSADFSPLTSEWIKADSIIHKAKIEVDREGTKAAAATAMFAVAGCAPMFDAKEVVLNRPFLFAIMHNETGLPVFTGCLNSL